MLKAMLKIFSIKTAREKTSSASGHDVLSHPAIAGMGEREIADLPLRPCWPAVRTAAGGCEPAACC